MSAPASQPPPPTLVLPRRFISLSLTHTLSLSYTHTHSLSHTHTHSLTHTLSLSLCLTESIAERSPVRTTVVSLSYLSFSHTLTVTLSLTHTHTLSVSLTHTTGRELMAPRTDRVDSGALASADDGRARRQHVLDALSPLSFSVSLSHTQTHTNTHKHSFFLSL